MHRPLTYLTTIGVVSVLCYFFLDLSQTGEETGEDSAATEVAFDGYSEGINTVFYNENGDVDYTLRATRQFHLKDQSALLEKPLYLEYRCRIGPRWRQY